MRPWWSQRLMSACDLSQVGLVDSERVPSSCRPKSCRWSRWKVRVAPLCFITEVLLCTWWILLSLSEKKYVWKTMVPDSRQVKNPLWRSALQTVTNELHCCLGVLGLWLCCPADASSVDLRWRSGVSLLLSFHREILNQWQTAAQEVPSDAITDEGNSRSEKCSPHLFFATNAESEHSLGHP